MANVKLSCTSSECVLAQFGGHKVTIDTSDEGTELFVPVSGKAEIGNALGIKGDYARLAGALVFRCPDTDAINTISYVGPKGQSEVGKLIIDAGLVATPLIG